jgi:predicted metal-dependent hydrolase
MQQLTYLAGYSPQLQGQVRQLLDEGKLSGLLLENYPDCHSLRSEQALYAYAVELKNRFLRTAPSLSKAIYDPKIHVIQHALGQHTRVSRIQGSQLKAKYEIRVATVFRQAPQAFLDMILIHELAHFKETDHNRAFYRLCRHMNPDYHQLEFDLRLYLTHLELVGELYPR